MDPSSSFTQIYRLAERAHYKLDHQIHASDHNLRVLIGHARLYDTLDDHVEQLRAQEDQRWFASSHSTEAGLAMRPSDSPQTIKQAKADIHQAVEELEDEYWASMGIPSDCEVMEGQDPDDLAESNDTEVNILHREDPLFDTHGSPAIIDASRPLVPKSPPIWGDATPQASVTETAVEDTSDSDSEPESESHTEPDSEPDADLEDPLDITKTADIARSNPWWRKFYPQKTSGREP
ncbi:MAG: hypothetical protein Q9222_003428 [Ikaeria aurantiellina]